MKWIGISGTWRVTNQQLETDVRSAVRAIFSNGDGIVSGGALGVDFFATDEALKCDPDAHRIKVILPTSLPVYAAHFRKRAREGRIASSDAEALIAQLEYLKERGSLVELGFDTCNQETYWARNTEVVRASDELAAFQVNGSSGTQNTIDSAREKGIPVRLATYSIPPSGQQAAPTVRPPSCA